MIAPRPEPTHEIARRIEIKARNGLSPGSEDALRLVKSWTQRVRYGWWAIATAGAMITTVASGTWVVAHVGDRLDRRLEGIERHQGQLDTLVPVVARLGAAELRRQWAEYQNCRNERIEGCVEPSP